MIKLGLSHPTNIWVHFFGRESFKQSREEGKISVQHKYSAVVYRGKTFCDKVIIGKEVGCRGVNIIMCII